MRMVWMAALTACNMSIVPRSGSHAKGNQRPLANIVGANCRECYPFKICEPLLESGSVWARVEAELGEFGSLRRPAPPRQNVQRPATDMLGTVPGDTYQVILRYGDGQPSTVRFDCNVWIGDFPCRAGTEARFSRTGELFAASL